MNCAIFQVSRIVKHLALLPYMIKKWPEESKEELYAAILCGEVCINGITEKNPKSLVPIESNVTRSTARFVSRGGEKLDRVLDKLECDPANKVCLDAGASTGGFTDCLLQRGAAKVYTVDSGYNQLAWKLKNDSRVVVKERFNIMKLEKKHLNPPPSLGVVDLSFRSLRKAASRILSLLTDGCLLALVKPQFEYPQEENFDGVVRTSRAREDVFYRLKNDLEAESVYIGNAAASPIPGRKGNAEIFVKLHEVPSSNTQFVENRIASALNDASEIYFASGIYKE